MGAIFPTPVPVAEAWDATEKATADNLSTTFRQLAERYPNKSAVISLHQHEISYGDHGEKDTQPIRWTFSELHEESLKFAKRLSAKGVTPGSHIVAIIFNQVEWALTFWAAAHLGCRFVPLDPRAFARKEDAQYLLGKLPVSAIVVSTEEMAMKANDALSTLHITPVIRCITDINHMESKIPGWTGLSDSSDSSEINDIPLPSSPSTPQEPAIIFFTSGTGGAPKACPQSAINIHAAALGFSNRLGLDSSNSVCQHLPSFHVFSVAITLSVWLRGGSIIFPSLSFDPSSSIQAIEYGRNVILPCVPLMAQVIAKSPTLLKPFDTLDSVIMGGAPVSPEAIEVVRSLGMKRIVVGFGMSEGVITLLNMMNADEAKPNANGDVSLGTVVSGSKVRICAPGSRKPLLRGESGELHQGGLPVFNGYLDLSDESCYQENGINFIVTGDQAYMDEEGHVYVLGRYKDLIIRGGENISPLKIENFLTQATGIAAQVVGIPHDLAGEVPVAILQQTATIKVSLEELHTTIVSELGAGFAPSMLLDLKADLGEDNFPSTTSGKIQKTTLRKWVLDYLSKAQPVELSSNSDALESELTVFWATLSGRKKIKIPTDVSVHRFTDSMMLIQFCSLVFERLGKRITMRDLVDYNTIQSQADFLRSRPEVGHPSAATKEVESKSIPFSILSRSGGDQSRLLSIKDATSEHLGSMELSWEHVEKVAPMTDIMTLMSRGARPNSWNHRHSIVIKQNNIPDLKFILRTWITKHPLMRSTVGSDGSDVDYYLIMAATDAWLQHQIFDGEEIDRSEDLMTYRLNDAAWDFVSPAGPLFKATILPIRDSSDIGLILHWHHAMFDGLIIKRWYLELTYLLNHKPSPICFHPFEHFSDAFYNYRQGPSAKEAVDFHVRRLRGIGSKREQIWPVQRAPRWLKGETSGWKHPSGELGNPDERVALDGDKSIGTMGSSLTVTVPNILKMRTEHEISPPIIVKAACALFNLHTMGGDEAIFASIESGRSWPVADTASAGGLDPSDDLINPLTIDGPTMTETINRIHLTPGETVRQFLTRLREEQREIDLYSHVPMAAVLDRLEDPADVETVRDVLQRQIYDWLPAARPVEQIENTLTEEKRETSDTKEASSMDLLECLGRTDLGIVWFPTLINEDTLHLDATWDNAQLRASEVNEAMLKFMFATVWLSDPENLERPLIDCEYHIPGLEVTDLGPFENHRN